MGCFTDSIGYEMDDIVRIAKEHNIKLPMVRSHYKWDGSWFYHPDTQEHLDKISGVLCTYCKSNKTSGTLAAWWKKHQIEDAEHEAMAAEAKKRKRLRKSALAKLSAAERKALLLDYE